jgi:bis(5'-nucleosyl)-tetraphosphatase (symmetrical)
VILLVGDVQGCDAALAQLLDLSGFSPSRDTLVMLGDLVNRGPDSLGVLKRLQTLGDAAKCLLGNHDLHLLAVAHGARGLQHGDTFADVLADPARDSWIDWLRHRPLALSEGGWLCVHAGLLPQWTAKQAVVLAAEVEQQLRGPDIGAFLATMYGNDPRRWDDALAGPARWRVVVNALTRLRFCTADGEIDFKTKEGAGAAPPGHFPWFEVADRRSAGEPIAFGHWSTLGLIDRPELLALDTGCVWGGALSAARVDGGRREVIQVLCAPADEGVRIPDTEIASPARPSSRALS